MEAKINKKTSYMTLTPKEKAIELTRMFKGYEMTNELIAIKQCALLVVENIIQQWEIAIAYIRTVNPVYALQIADLEYWQQVKQEIEKL
jgi:hypothetical protein